MRRRPGRPAVVDRARIAAAALELGLDSVTLPALAAHLGVHHSTLYGHVADRADVDIAVGELLARSVPWPDGADDWHELLTAYGQVIWALCERHPGAAELIQSLPAPPAEVVDRFTRLRARLVELGLDAHDAAVALDLVADLALDTAASLRRLDRAVQSRAWAGAPEMVEAVGSRRGWYDHKLAIVLDGLAARNG